MEGSDYGNMAVLLFFVGRTIYYERVSKRREKIEENHYNFYHRNDMMTTAHQGTK